MERDTLINEIRGKKCGVYIAREGFEGNFEATFDEIDDHGQLIGDCRMAIDWNLFKVTKISDDIFELSDGNTIIEITSITE